MYITVCAKIMPSVQATIPKAAADLEMFQGVDRLLSYHHLGFDRTFARLFRVREDSWTRLLNHSKASNLEW